MSQKKPRIKLLKIAVIGTSFWIGAILLTATIISFSRQSGGTGIDAGAIQQKRAQALISKADNQPHPETVEQ